MAELIVTCSLRTKSLGQIVFEAYNAAGANPGKTWNGLPVPTWENLTEDVRTKWEAGGAGTLQALHNLIKMLETPGDADETAAFAELMEALKIQGVPVWEVR